ncbi:MAG: MFS transporter [Fibrobacterales bacterium]
MNIFRLFASYPKQFTFSMSHAFLSGYGQSFFLGLFTPFFIIAFNISSTEMTFYYFLATISSAVIMAQAGVYIDRVNLKLFSGISLLGLGVMTYTLSQGTHIIALFFGLMGLRLFGQSLMTHIGATATSRFFTKDTGKALSISTLGHPLGEFFFSAVGVYLIATIGWRDTLSWFAYALIFIAPALLMLFKKSDTFNLPLALQKDNAPNARSWTRGDVLKNSFFYCAVPVTLAAPFLLTGFFIHQQSLMEAKGWSDGWRLAAFSLFPILRITSGFIIGFIIDRFGAKNSFLIQLIPTIIALSALIFIDHQVSAAIYYGMCGIALGFGSNLKSTLWVEEYGRANIGAIRSVVAMLTAFSTAISPVIFSLFLDNGFSVIQICIYTLVAVSIVGVVYFGKVRLLKE